MSKIISGPLTCVALLVFIHAAQAFELASPVECAVGKDCFVQNYPDVDPTPGYHDYRCGTLTYNGHDGTDFRLRDLPQMQKGVAVLAAADGVIKAVRDGMKDQSIRDAGLKAIKDRECGNGVVIEHEDGFETQYCHLRQGSLRVRKGQTVHAGDALGLIGLSGETEFPHVHLTVRRNGKTLDPFTGMTLPDKHSFTAGKPPICRFDDAAVAQASLWRKEEQGIRTYVPTALLDAGFSHEVPSSQAARAGKYSEEQGQLPVHAHALVFWVDIMGVEPGDTLLLDLRTPQGSALATQSKHFDRPLAQQFMFIGKQFADGAISTGDYTATVRLLRGKEQKTVFEASRRVSAR